MPRMISSVWACSFFPFLSAGVGLEHLVAVDELARQVVGVALLVDPDLLHHLPHDDLDVLVVDVHALRLVDLLHLDDEVLLGLRAPLELVLAGVGQDVVRVDRALVELVARHNLLALLDQQPRAARERVGVLLACGVGHDHLEALLGVLHVHRALDGRELGQALRLACLEQLHHARETVRDVRPGDTAGVEGPQRQLRARLADRLRGDDAHRVADRHHLAGGGRLAVAVLAHALGAALEHRAHGHAGLLVAVRLGHLLDVGLRDQLALLDQAASALRAEVHSCVAPLELAVGTAAVVVQRHLDELAGAAVVLAHDHVLRHVHEPPGEVARVRGAERGVREALAGAVGRDEVLEHRQALHEVGLDRALDDLALRIRHEAAHAGELADLLERSARAGVGHHEDGVEQVEVALHRLADLVGRGRPLLGHRHLALLVGDQARVVLVLDLADLAPRSARGSPPCRAGSRRRSSRS